RPLTQSWDRSVSHLGITADGRRLLAIAEDLGQASLFGIDTATGTPHKLVGTGHVSSFSASVDSVVFAWENIGAPADLFSVAATAGTPRRLTQVNQELLGRRVLGAFEQFNFKGWNDETVYGYVVKPYGFDPGKRYPVAFLVHGGPQNNFGNYWTYRWNA